MRVQGVKIPCKVDIHPTSQQEFILLPTLLRTEMVKESLDVLFHQIAELFHHRFLQFKQIERIMPTSEVRAARGVPRIGPQSDCELLEFFV